MVEDQVLDRAYAALADPTRRRLLEALRDGDARITDLAAQQWIGDQTDFWSARADALAARLRRNNGRRAQGPGQGRSR